MIKALTVSQAKPKLASLLDQAVKGRAIYLRRKVKLANRASPSFAPTDEN